VAAIDSQTDGGGEPWTAEPLLSTGDDLPKTDLPLA
jgi:hypothetical protein